MKPAKKYIFGVILLALALFSAMTIGYAICICWHMEIIKQGNIDIYVSKQITREEYETAIMAIVCSIVLLAIGFPFGIMLIEEAAEEWEWK